MGRIGVNLLVAEVIFSYYPSPVAVKEKSTRETFLRLHNSLVLSKIMGVKSVVLHPSYLNKLDVFHHAGLRINIDAFKSTTVMSLYSESGFYSIENCRSKICMHYFGRVSTKYFN